MYKAIKLLSGIALSLNYSEAQAAEPFNITQKVKAFHSNVSSVEARFDITDTEMDENSRDSSIRSSLEENRPLSDDEVPHLEQRQSNVTSHTRKPDNEFNSSNINNTLSKEARLQSILGDQALYEVVNEGNLWNWFANAENSNLNEFKNSLQLLPEQEFDQQMASIKKSKTLSLEKRLKLSEYYTRLVSEPTSNQNICGKRDMFPKAIRKENGNLEIEFSKQIDSTQTDSNGDLLLYFAH